MWLLESAKHRILGVNTSTQQVLPPIQYGTTCLLIRNTIGCVSCSDEWGMDGFLPGIHLVHEGPVGGNLNIASRAYGQKHSKA
jgi:hypothetical protein